MDTRSYAFLILFLTFIFTYRRRRVKGQLPPGPQALPLIGNLLDIPQSRPWIKFGDWKKQYGDIVYLNALGQPMIVLNSLKACNDLLDRRSAIYSDRKMTMLYDVIGWNFNFGVMPYSPRWRRHRRAFHRYLNEGVAIDHRPVQETITHLLLHRLLQSPDRFKDHIRLSFAESIMKVCYDIKVKGLDDPYVTTGETVIGPISSSGLPGKYWVNIFPILKHVPSWMPGAGFKQQAKKWNKVLLDMKELPYLEAQENIARGKASPSMVSAMLSGLKEDNVEESSDSTPSGTESIEELAKCVSSAAYAAGADTTITAVLTFLMVIAKYPEAQRLAQAELDSVVGTDRLPTFADKKSLPYVNALVKELLRWHVIAPLPTPHVSTQDDEYEGYFIPKGTVVMANVWLILRNPEVYPDPETFNPSRWLDQTEEGKKLNPSLQDPIGIFGFGRRICAGRNFADNALFITVANLLACFNITPLDSSPSDQPVKHIEEEFTDDFVSRPVPFKVSIKPRSQNAVSRINEAMARLE